MSLAYSPKGNKGRSTVAHIRLNTPPTLPRRAPTPQCSLQDTLPSSCTTDATFTAPTTFPSCKTPLDYAELSVKFMTTYPQRTIWFCSGIALEEVTAEQRTAALRRAGERKTGRQRQSSSLRMGRSRGGRKSGTS